MGLFFRKSFSAGPMRFNLSKHGVGTSIGVKGLRIGRSASGKSYVQAGGGGLYYKKTFGSNVRTSSESNNSIAVILLVIIALGMFAVIIEWFAEHLVVLLTTSVVCICIGVCLLVNIKKTKKAIAAYLSSLENIIDNPEAHKNADLISGIIKAREKLTKNDSNVQKLKNAERQVYLSALDKIIDDGYITEEEKEILQILENVLALPDSFKVEKKVDVFRMLYLDVISDRMVSQEEFNKIINYQIGLGLQDSDVVSEIKVINEFIRMQLLSAPLKKIDVFSSDIQKQEHIYYKGTGKVLSRKKSKKYGSKDYEYDVRRDGELIVTNKRMLVINNGVTTVNLNEILDIDVDIDKSMVIISKESSSMPVLIELSEPIYFAKIIDILSTNLRSTV